MYSFHDTAAYKVGRNEVFKRRVRIIAEPASNSKECVNSWRRGPCLVQLTFFQLKIKSMCMGKKRVTCQYDQELDSKRKKSKAQKQNQSGEREPQTLPQFLKEALEALSKRGKSQKCCLVALPTTSGGDIEKDDSYDVTNPLLRRLNAKNWVLNPWSSDGNHPRPLYFDELMKLAAGMEKKNLKFTAEDTLYISGHGVIFSLSGLSPEELASNLAELIRKTGLTRIKLAACDTATRFYPEEIKQAQEREDLDLPTNLSEEALNSSYVQRVSASLREEGYEEVDLYGYRGTLMEIKQKNNKEGPVLHTYSLLSSIDSAGTVSHNSRVYRASEARVHFKAGKLVERPAKAIDNDIIVSGKNFPYKAGY